MKAHHFLAALLLVLSFSIKFSYSQNEIEKYKQPDLIEGSNLLINASPYYSNEIYDDSTKYNRLSISAEVDFIKWRYTPKLDYSVRIKPSFSTAREGIHNFVTDTVYKSSSASTLLLGGMNFYPFKKPFYGGLFYNSEAHFSSSTKPSSNNDLFTYIGFGRLYNAGQVIFAKNFENVLLDEGIITQKLPSNVLRKLTILLDKRYNQEFFSKFREDADIEFFSQIEQLLLNEKVIQTQLGSRTTLKLFQALTSYSFVNYPRYNGYLIQTELNYNNISFYEQKNYSNTIWVNLSGITYWIKNQPVVLGVCKPAIDPKKQKSCKS